MKEKTIKSILLKKFNEFVESIDDPNVKQIVKENTIITGGAITSLMLNERPNDYDLYFRTKAAALSVAKYYAKKFNSYDITGGRKVLVIDSDKIIKKDDNTYLIGDPEIAEAFDSNTFTGLNRTLSNMANRPDRVKLFIRSFGMVKDENYYDDRDADLIAADQVMEDPVEELDEMTEPVLKDKYRLVFITSNAISLSGQIQIIVRFFGEPSQIHETYDFQHCMGYWTSWDNNLLITKDTYECVLNKNLIYCGSLYPVCSMFRMRKFIKRGWNINAGQILKIAFQISELNLNDLDTLEDQLIGVDSSYFMQIIDQLRDQQDKNPGWQYSQPYLISIIDKIF